jgi:hypothetical protein
MMSRWSVACRTDEASRSTTAAIDDLVDFLVEQTYLAAEQADRSEDATRKRLRCIIIPALEARTEVGGEVISRQRQVGHAVSLAIDALQNLAECLAAQRP